MEGFDLGGLRHNEVVERINLPDEATIQAERTHVEHLATIGAFDQASLTPVKVLEPLTGPEVSKLEKAREGISSELAAFDKADLKETEVEEKVVLPGKEEIKAEKTIQGMLQVSKNSFHLVPNICFISRVWRVLQRTA